MGTEGREFIQNLANWTGATVYANSVGTGPYKIVSTIEGWLRLTQDWGLDVVKSPETLAAGCTPQNLVEAPLGSDNEINLMFPGGIMVEIENEAIEGQGKITILNTFDHLEELGIDTQGTKISAAYDISLEGLVIKDNMWIQITLPYDDISSIDSSNITVRYWDDGLQQWSDVGIWDVQVNEEDHYVTFKTNHATVFAVMQETAQVPGDLDGDGNIDKNDLNILLSYRNQPASACPACDLNGDGMITALDARKLVLLCTRPRCACEEPPE